MDAAAAVYHEITSELDPREILRYLNYMGIRNITGEVLKFFINDLKKLIKYDLQQKHLAINPESDNYDLAWSERLYSASTFSSRLHSQTQTKMPICNRECNRFKQPLRLRNIKSAPNLCQKNTVEDNFPRRACSCIRVEKKPDLSRENRTPQSTSSNIIRVPKPQVQKKCDPVALYHYYNCLWEKYKPNVPGENNWADLRWSIRQKLAGCQEKHIVAKVKMSKSRINKIIKRDQADTPRTKRETELDETLHDDFEIASAGPSKPVDYDQHLSDFVTSIENQIDDWILCKEPPLEDFDSDDSVKDRDYLFRESDLSTNSSVAEDEFQNTHAKKLNKRGKKEQKTHQVKRIKTTRRSETVTSEKHLINVQNAIQEKVSNEEINLGFVEQELNNSTDNMMIEPVETNKIFVVDSYGKVMLKEIENNITSTIINESAKNNVCNNLTKKGTVRKRCRYATKLKDRQQIKMEKKITSFKPKLPCSEKCRKKCTTFISEARRQEINSYYWKLNRQAQVVFVTNSTRTASTKTKTKIDSQRKNTNEYFFKSVDSENSSNIAVCKHFFLTTLGYHAKNDYAILKAISDPNEAIIDKRGKHTKTVHYDRKNIHEHIMSFGPAVSHYRREHAPNKKYLPSDLSVRAMYDDFKNKYPVTKCSYELYRHILKTEMNISLAKLGNEECESCEIFNKHDDDHAKNPVENCEICTSYKAHKIRVVETRSEYQKDAEHKQDMLNNYYSADLQKVIMLPRLDSFKKVIFCPRIIVFNESFVPLGSLKKASDSKIYAVIWHEAVSGRRKEDIISTYYDFLKYKRDVENITIWADNCASQNKCWSLFSFLSYIINSKDISAKTITFKYFEPGHSFMSADNFHHQVEQAMRHNPKIYDFHDFYKTVQSASSKVDVKIMTVGDFYDFEDSSSTHRLKNALNRIYLRDIVEVQVRRGSSALFVKKSFQDIEYIELMFLKKKYEKTALPVPVEKTAARGIHSDRKAAIIKELGCLMPSNRLQFWRELPENNLAVDLRTRVDDGCD